MPQAATPNMGLIKPTENGDSGVWASLLDAMFDLIDQHDHSTGKGVKVSMFNGVTVAADIPWSNGGTFYAIKDLKAIDFQPTTQASVSAFAGALFVDSSNNELSYRTTGGSIIRFTNGATFNFSAIGAIGGDYSSVGALVDFVDANDFYRFRQQVGGGVQQYARLECGGVDLFEYKAHPAVGVPANRVRMSSPAALAASYDMTWPGALPASTLPVKIDNTGQISFAPNTLTYQHSSALTLLGDATASKIANGSTLGPEVALSTSVNEHVMPLSIPIGTITAFDVKLNKSSAAGTVTVKLFEANAISAPTQIGATQSNGAANPGNITLAQSGLSFAMTAGRQYYIVLKGGGTTGDIALTYSATVTA